MMVSMHFNIQMVIRALYYGLQILGYTVFLNSYLIPEASSTCVDIAFYKRFPEYIWSFGHCSHAHKWFGPGTYTEKCCFSDAINMLTCSTTYKEGDWSNNVLMILGRHFCDDLVEREARINLNISGMCVISCPYVS